MAVIAFKKTDEYLLRLSKLTAKTEEVAQKALEEGSAIVANQMRANLNGIPTIPTNEAVQNYRSGKQSSGITYEQKKGLSDHFGITPIQKKDTTWNAHVGLDDVNSVKTRKYPKGQPNQLVARSLEKGTSAVARHPFCAPAVAKTRQKCIEAMQKAIDEEFDKIMN